MNEHAQTGYRKFKEAFVTPDPFKAAILFKEAGIHYNHTGAAVEALYSFNLAEQALVCVITHTLPFPSGFDLDAMYSDMRMRIEIADAMALSANLSPEIYAKVMDFDPLNWRGTLSNPVATDLVIQFYNSDLVTRYHNSGPQQN